MKKRASIAVLLVAVLGIGITGCGRGQIVIGALVSTTNAQGVATEGMELLRGMNIAVDEINENGGIGGSNLVIEHVDVRGEESLARSAFAELEEMAPLFYVSSLSTISAVTAELAEAAAAPMIASVASSPGIVSDKRWAFRYWPQLADEREPVLRLLDTVGPQSLLFVYSDESYGQSFVSTFVAPLESRGVVVESRAYPPSVTDFEPSGWNADDFDTLFLVGYPSHLALLLPAVEEYGYTGRRVTTNGMSSPSLSSMPSMEGVYLTAPAIYNPAHPFARHFGNAYKEIFDAPANHHASGGYDLVNLVAELLEDRTVSRAILRDALEGGFIFSGANGSVETQPGDHDFTFPFLPARVRNGRIEYL